VIHTILMILLAVPVTAMIIDLLKGGEPARAEVEINENKFKEDVKCQK